MTTKSPTFHVQLFSPTFSPFSNDPEVEKRSFHWQRSTHRLEAARKATPPFLDLDSKMNIMTNPPTSPRSRAIRRKGQLFNSPTSISSGSTESIESGYMFVNAQVQSDFQPHSPSSSCSLSPPGNPVTNGNRGISGKARAGKRVKTTKTEGPQPLAQPFLLQLRSLPVPPTANIKPSESNAPATNNSKYLSPNPSRFNMHSTTTTSSSRPRQVLSADEERKLAKVRRFLGVDVPPEALFHSSTTLLGENIPPEALFPSSPPTTALQRTTSVSRTLRKKVSHKASPSLAVIPTSSNTSTPLLPVLDCSATTPTTPQSQSTGESPSRVEHQRTTRPRSMTPLPSPTMATPSSYRGASLDRPTNAPFQEIVVVGPETKGDELFSLEWGRRKGKDWSGEWNVKDMNRVANALRGLKARWTGFAEPFPSLFASLSLRDTCITLLDEYSFPPPPKKKKMSFYQSEKDSSFFTLSFMKHVIFTTHILNYSILY